MLSRFKRTTLFFLSIFFVLSFSATNSLANSIPAPQKLMQDTSATMVKAFIDRADEIKTSPDVAHTLIKDYLVPKINFPLMSRSVLGKNWRKASNEQKQDFQIGFQALVIRFYSAALLDFLQDNELKEDMIKFVPFRGELKDKRATVRSLVYPPSGGEAIKVNYSLYYGKKQTWQVYDVKIEGISLISNYRSSFKQIVSKKGIDGLLAEIKTKNFTQKTSQ